MSALSVRAVASPVLMASLLAAGLTGCMRPTPVSHADAVDRAACRQRAEQVYRMQNRDEVYRADLYATSSRDAPYAGTGLPGVPTKGLSNEFSREQMVSDCLRSSAGNVGTSPAAPPPDSSPARP